VGEKRGKDHELHMSDYRVSEALRRKKIGEVGMTRGLTTFFWLPL